MSDMGISPEDRERLAKTKFGEWFDEFWDKKFGESFEKAVTEARKAPAPSSEGRSEAPQQPAARPQRKRSLLEECFSQTFGF